MDRNKFDIGAQPCLNGFIFLNQSLPRVVHSYKIYIYNLMPAVNTTHEYSLLLLKMLPAQQTSQIISDQQNDIFCQFYTVYMSQFVCSVIIIVRAGSQSAEFFGTVPNANRNCNQSQPHHSATTSHFSMDLQEIQQQVGWSRALAYTKQTLLIQNNIISYNFYRHIPVRH